MLVFQQLEGSFLSHLFAALAEDLGGAVGGDHKVPPVGESLQGARTYGRIFI